MGSNFRFPKTGIIAVLAILLPFLHFASPAHAQHQSLIFGTELDYPPYSFLDEDGNPTGYNVDLARAIAQVMHFNVEIRMGPWAEIRAALERGEIDAIVGMFHSPERDLSVDFSHRFTTIHHSIFVHGDSPTIDVEADLENKSLIVMQGDIMHDQLLNNPLISDITTTSTQAEALRLLAQGGHDGAIIAQLPGLFWVKELGLSGIETTGPLFHFSDYCLAVQEGDTTLLNMLNEGLATLASIGREEEIFDRWLGVLHNDGVTRAKIRKSLIIILVPVIVLYTFLFFHTAVLKREVARRTEDLKRKTKDYQDLFGKMLNGFAVHEIICDEKGIPFDYRFLDLNPAFEQFTGLTKDAACGKTLREIMPEADPVWIEKFGKVALTGEPAHFEQHSPDLGKTFEVSAFQSSPNQFACVFDDITEQKQSQHSLALYRSKLQSLASRLANTEELLRQDISAGLHDSIGQDLVALKLSVDIMRQANNSTDPSSLAKLETNLDNISRSLDDVVKKIWSLAFQLSPPGLFESGLQSALEWLIHDLTEKNDVKIELEVLDAPLALDMQARGLLFRVIRECLVNAMKHGQPSQIKIVLTRENGNLLATVSDDGQGFDVAEAMAHAETTKSFGLFSIRERLAFQSGSLEIDSSPGEGTRISICFPLSEKEESEPEVNETH